MSVTFEEAELRAIARFLSHLFGIPPRDDAAALTAPIHQLQHQVQTMSDKLQSGLDQLKADVAAQATVIASATTAFQGLSKQLDDALEAAKAAGATEAQLAELTTLQQGVEANTAALAAAVPQNTPAADSGSPAPVPAPAPAPVPVAGDAPAPADQNAPAGTETSPTPGEPT